MLTASELSRMRSTAGAALPDSAVIQTQSVVSDGGGGGTTTWTASGTVDCRIAPASMDEDELGGRVASEADFIVTMPHDAAVTTDSRLIISGGTFNVEAVLERSWEISTRLHVCEVT